MPLNTMKNINQIKQKIKKSGLTGAAARIELEQKITKRAEILAAEIVASCDNEKTDYDYLIERFFEILEFFATGEIDDLAKRDLANALQEHIFKFSKDYFKSFDEYKQNLTGEVNQ